LSSSGFSRKILIISRSFYPTNAPRAIRATELAKEFSRQGHKVTILTVRNDSYHTRFEKEYGVNIKDLGPIRFPEIDFTGRNDFVHLIGRILKRGLNLLFEYPDIELMYRVKQALASESGYDLLISIAVPHPIHWGVAWARKENTPIANTWVADCGDPYYGLENDSFNVPFYFAFIEKWFCRKTDFISIPFEGAKSAYFKEFHPKIRVIPQGLSFPELVNRKNKHENDIITFAYFGNIESYLHYARPFLETLNTIQQPFKFIVFTRRKDIFKQYLNLNTLRKCSIRDYVKRNRLFEELRHVDFFVHFPYRKGTQQSLKLVDYSYI